MANIGIYDGKTVKGPLDSGDGQKEVEIGKSGWPSWMPKKVLDVNDFHFYLGEDDVEYSETDGYIVSPKGYINHFNMSNVGGSNFGDVMFMFDIKTLLRLNAKYKINGLRGVPKNPKELFLLAQLCGVCHYAHGVADILEYGSDKEVWNTASDKMKQLAIDVYTLNNNASTAKRRFPQGINTIAEERAMSWKEIIESKIEEKIMARLQNEEDSDYQEFFKKALEKFGVESPAELESDEKKKEFFDYVDKNWKGDNEKAEDTEASDTLEPGKKKKLAASNCGS
jgi:hypothetical protein